MASDGRPKTVKTSLAYTLQRLGLDYVDIYRPARLDPEVPVEETIGAIAEMVQAGYVRHIGLSEVGVDTIRRAAAVHPICDLQIEYSLLSRGIESAILPALRELCIGVTAYGVLSRGLIGGNWQAGRQAPGDFRPFSPRFKSGAVEHNLGLATRLKEVAASLGLTTAQAAIAWVASRGDDIVPLVGARNRFQLADAEGGVSTPLSSDDVATIEAAVPINSARGDRYPQAQLATLDSES